MCLPGLRAAGSTRGAPPDPGNETQHAAKSESAPRAIPQPSPPRSHLPLLKPRVRKVRRGRAEDEEGARSPVALPSQQGGEDTNCGTGRRERPARPPPVPAYLRSPPGTSRPPPLVCMPGPVAPSRGSAPARPLGARRSRAWLSPSPRQRRARLGRGTGLRAPPRAG